MFRCDDDDTLPALLEPGAALLSWWWSCRRFAFLFHFTLAVGHLIEWAIFLLLHSQLKESASSLSLYVSFVWRLLCLYRFCSGVTSQFCLLSSYCRFTGAFVCLLFRLSIWVAAAGDFFFFLREEEKGRAEHFSWRNGLVVVVVVVASSLPL